MSGFIGQTSKFVPRLFQQGASQIQNYNPNLTQNQDRKHAEALEQKSKHISAYPKRAIIPTNALTTSSSTNKLSQLAHQSISETVSASGSSRTQSTASLKKSKSVPDASSTSASKNAAHDVMLYAMASLHLDQENRVQSSTKMIKDGEFAVSEVRQIHTKKRRRNRRSRNRPRSGGSNSDSSNSPEPEVKVETEQIINKTKQAQPQLIGGLKGSKSSPNFQEEKWAAQQKFLANRSASRTNLQHYNSRRNLSTTPAKNFFFSKGNSQKQQPLAESGPTSVDAENSSPDNNNNTTHPFKKILNESKAYQQNSKLFTIGCGFSKDDDPRIQLTQNIDKYCISDESDSRKFGEDAAFIFSSKTTDILGVSDGVGGWRNHGVDPSKFSHGLMENAKKLAQAGDFKVDQPVQLLSRAYNQLTSVPGLIGSATAVLASFDRVSGMLYTANLGDSGFLVIRDGKLVKKSEPQCHSFNAPFQLAIVPASQRRGSFNDTPQKADFDSFQCQEGDIIILASDGLFDNVHLQHVTQLLDIMKVTPAELLRSFGNKSPGANDSEQDSTDSGIQELEQGEDEPKIMEGLERAAANFVTLARRNAHDEKYDSPFAREAMRYGYRTTGGKVDDITILVSIVGSTLSS